MKTITQIEETHNNFGDQIFTLTYSDGSKEREIFQEGDWHTKEEVIYVNTGVRS